MKTVQMVARVGDEEIPVGTCHPAQARVLIKRQLAAWQDNKLLLSIRPVFQRLLDTNKHAWEGPADDNNVSPAELRRREAWFASFVGKAARALVAGAAPVSPAGSHPLSTPRKDRCSAHARYLLREGGETERIGAKALVTPDDLPEMPAEEVVHYYQTPENWEKEALSRLELEDPEKVLSSLFEMNFWSRETHSETWERVAEAYRLAPVQAYCGPGLGLSEAPVDELKKRLDLGWRSPEMEVTAFTLDLKKHRWVPDPDAKPFAEFLNDAEPPPNEPQPVE